jgi:hypothetical protein
MGKAKRKKPIVENPALMAAWDFDNNPSLDPSVLQAALVGRVCA